MIRNTLFDRMNVNHKTAAPSSNWVFRRQNKKEKYAPRNIQMKTKSRNVSHLIWGCFVGNKLGPIVYLPGTVTQDIYMKVLRTEFKPFLNVLAEDRVTNLEFQQDNATPHVATRTREYLKSLVKNTDLQSWICRQILLICLPSKISGHISSWSSIGNILTP